MSNTSTSNVTYTKLRDGSWGLRGPGLAGGRTVTVTKRSGETKSETVGRVIWTGQDKRTGETVSIASIASCNSSRSRRGRYDERDGYCGYKCPVSGHRCTPANGPCHDCQ